MAIAEHSPLPLATVEGASHIVRYVNPAFCRLLDKPADKLLGIPFAEMMQDKDEFLTMLDQVYHTRKSASHTKRQHSQPHPVFWSYTMWPVLAGESSMGVMIQVTETAHSQEQMVALNEALMLGSLRQHELTETAESLNSRLQQEMTERKQAEKAMRQSEERFRALVMASSDAVYRMSPDWSEMRQLHGQNFIADTTAPNDNWLQEYIHADDRQRVLAVIHEAIRTKSLFEMEHQVVTVDGSLGWTCSRAVPMLDANGEIVEWFGTASDVTEQKRAAQALLESELRYRNLFNSIDEGFCIIEMIFDEHQKPVDWRYLEVNPSFVTLTGIHDIVGKRIRELVPDHEAYWFEIYGRVVLTGEAVRFVNQAKGLDNRWFDLYAFPLGELGSRKVAVLFTNITERKKTEEALRQSEGRFRVLFDHGPIAMYSCDASGGNRQFNSVAMDLWGLDAKGGKTGEQLDGSFKTYLPDGRSMNYAETPMTKVLRGVLPVVHDMEMVIERPNGSRINVIANIVPLKNEMGEITGAINCFYDITERSRLERHAQEQAEALADLHRRKDEFLAMLSHELRNPLAPISNAVHLLRMQKNEDPIQGQARGIIERQVGQLTRLIDDLMEVSRIATGRIHLQEERVTVNGIVKNAVETVRPLIDKHQHSLELNLSAHPIWLYADASRLEQVVVNLLTNAAKYTEPGGSIWVTAQQEGSEAVLRVRDSGVGIAPDLLPHVFELFTQAERSLARSEGGLGIGLSLVKRLVEMHGGKVDASSSPGVGSEFVVRLPVMATPQPPSLQGIEASTTVAGSLRVLVVEDNIDAAETMTLVLEASGHDVRTAHDGDTGLKFALDFRPNVVLLDIGLPGMDGFEVAKRLRQQAHLGNVVLVAMTGYGEASARQLSREAGFDHHLVKPADFGKLQDILAGAAADTSL